MKELKDNGITTPITHNFMGSFYDLDYFKLAEQFDFILVYLETAADLNVNIYLELPRGCFYDQKGIVLNEIFSRP